MSEIIKYGESYSVLAKKIAPYLNQSTTLKPNKTSTLKYGDTYENLADNINYFLPNITSNIPKRIGKIKYGQTYESLAYIVKSYVYPQPTPNTKYSIKKYPPWWETTITLYNRYENKTTQLVTWYKNVITDCYFKNSYQSIEMDNVLALNNGTLIRIPVKDNFTPYSDWVKIPNLLMGKYFTLHQGDIIIVGEVNDIIDETKRGMFSNDIIEKYKELGICTLIKSTQYNVGTGIGIPHYRVMGD